jgi:phosphate transport system substrate-binding protein
VKANLDSLTEAAASVQEIPADFRVSITNAPGNNAYPIASFTWFLVPQEFPDLARGKT